MTKGQVDSLSISTELYIDPEWQTQAMQAGLWAQGHTDDGEPSNAWGIIEFTTVGFDEDLVAHPDPRWRVWVSGEGQWSDLDLDVVYGDWIALRIEFDVNGQSYDLFIDNELQASITVDLDHPLIEPSGHIGQVAFNSYNYAHEQVAEGLSNDGYDVHWHGLSREAVFSSIKEAVDVAIPGSTVSIGPGTYDEGTAFWQVNKPLTIKGSGSDRTVIDRSASESYGLLVNNDNVRLEGFTLIGPQTGPVQFGLKAEEMSGLVLDDVVVLDSGRTGIDLNGVHDAVMTGVGSHNNSGAGIAIRDGTGITIDGVRTSGNAWGGLALWAMDDEVLSDVSVTNSTFTGEPAGVFAQHDGTFEGIVFTDNVFTDNGVQVTDQTEKDALYLKSLLADNTFDRAVVARDGDTYRSSIFSQIQDGIDIAVAGDAVEVYPADYDENLHISTDGLALLAVETQATTITQASNGPPLIAVEGDDVTVDGFLLSGFTSSTSAGAIDVQGKNTTLQNLEVLEEKGGTWSLWIHDGADGAKVLDSTFEAIERSNRMLRVDDAAGVHIEGNLFAPVEGEADRIGGPWVRTSQDIQLVNNTVLQAWGEGITINQQGPPFEGQQIVLQGNTVVLADETNEAGLPGLAIKKAPGTINGMGDEADFLPQILEENPGIRSMNLFDKWLLTEEGHRIQDFIDVAQSGATVYVGPGSYPEDLLVDGKNLSIAGSQVLDESAAEPIVVGSLVAVSSESLWVEGLNVAATQDNPLRGVAFGAQGPGELNLVNNTFTANGQVTKSAPHFFSGLVDVSGVTIFSSEGNTLIGSPEGPSGSSALRVEYNEAGNVSVLMRDTEIKQHMAAGFTISGTNPSAAVSLIGNHLLENGDGLLVHSAQYQSLDLVNNTFADQSGVGVRMVGETRGETILRHNGFTGNGIGLAVGSEADGVDARYNWWGSALGPIFGDQANTLLIDYTPWCLDEGCSIVGGAPLP